MRRRLLLAGAAVATAGCSTASRQALPPAGAPLPAPSPAPQPPPNDQPPPAPREFRAAWVASVANIDWPSRPGLPAAAQRAEALAILDRARAIGLNAIILQVRPAGDALYPSALEPWSEYLGGAQGRGPSPAYDPLQFWLNEAHTRGLELHAWFNPYRARHSTARTALVAPHLAVARPDAVKPYGDALWMDPGEPAAQQRTLAVVADVVRRYDIDGVHLDDYFYPYPVVRDGGDLPFPDDPAWVRYLKEGGPLARDDWRRANVNALVQGLQRTIRAIRPQVRLGISPFGIGRPDRRPPGIEGFSQYDRLYADVEEWLEQGWCDYLVPQLYWPIDRAPQSFAVLLAYWLAQNRRGRHVWPGLYTSMVGAVRDPWPAAEILNQVALARRPLDSSPAPSPTGTGQVHFSMVALMQDRDGIATRLQRGPYARPALLPATPWIDDRAPPAPRLRLDGARLIVERGAGSAPWVWAVWQSVAGEWRFDVVPGHESVPEVDARADAIAVSAVDRLGNESPRAMFRLRPAGAA